MVKCTIRWWQTKRWLQKLRLVTNHIKLYVHFRILWIAWEVWPSAEYSIQPQCRRHGDVRGNNKEWNRFRAMGLVDRFDLNSFVMISISGWKNSTTFSGPSGFHQLSVCWDNFHRKLINSNVHHILRTCCGVEWHRYIKRSRKWIRFCVVIVQKGIYQKYQTDGCSVASYSIHRWLRGDIRCIWSHSILRQSTEDSLLVSHKRLDWFHRSNFLRLDT